MMLNTIRFVSVVLTAVAMAGALAHLFELPNKINLPREEYLAVQRLYQGWALLGIPVVGALLSTGAWMLMVRDNPREFFRTLGATLCIGLALVIFFVFTYPANQHGAPGLRRLSPPPEGWRASFMRRDHVTRPWVGQVRSFHATPWQAVQHAAWKALVRMTDAG